MPFFEGRIGVDNIDERRGNPGAKNIRDITKEEIEQYQQIESWRIWVSAPHYVSGQDDHLKELKKVEENPLSIIITPESAIHDFIELKVFGYVTPFKVGSFDVHDFVLEPLDKETVARIDREGGDQKSIIKSGQIWQIFNRLD
jgi:hypothetical protein